MGLGSAGLLGLKEYLSSAGAWVGAGLTGVGTLLVIWGRFVTCVVPRFCPTWKYWYLKLC